MDQWKLLTNDHDHNNSMKMMLIEDNNNDHSIRWQRRMTWQSTITDDEHDDHEILSTTRMMTSSSSLSLTVPASTSPPLPVSSLSRTWSPPVPRIPCTCRHGSQLMGFKNIKGEQERRLKHQTIIAVFMWVLILVWGRWTKNLSSISCTHHTICQVQNSRPISLLYWAYIADHAVLKHKHIDWNVFTWKIRTFGHLAYRAGGGDRGVEDTQEPDDQALQQ